jgi:MFS family permease
MRQPATGSWSRRWFLVAPTLLFLWIIAQIDKTNVSLFIADAKFLKELNLTGHNAGLGGLMSTFFIGYGVSIFARGFLVDRFGPRLCAMAGILGWDARCSFPRKRTASRHSCGCASCSASLKATCGPSATR